MAKGEPNFVHKHRVFAHIYVASASAIGRVHARVLMHIYTERSFEMSNVVGFVNVSLSRVFRNVMSWGSVRSSPCRAIYVAYSI